MIKSSKKIFIGVAVTVVLLMVLILILRQQDHENVVERDVESASESIRRVINDGAKALRGAAEGVNDAVYE